MTGNVLGLDLATTFGWAVGTPDMSVMPTSGQERFASEGATHPMVFRAVQKKVYALIKEHRPMLVVIEQPLATKFVQEKTNSATTALLFGMSAVSQAVCVACGLNSQTIKVVPVQEGRKLFLGRGNMPGDQAKRLVRDGCRDRGWIDDFQLTEFDRTDALALMAYGCAQLSAAYKTQMKAGR